MSLETVQPVSQRRRPLEKERSKEQKANETGRRDAREKLQDCSLRERNPSKGGDSWWAGEYLGRGEKKKEAGDQDSRALVGNEGVKGKSASN